ncbi:substrate-binding periplasmic protein [Vreelandella neptunia]|uniref:Transporter substrate-binding domain-containing protein n=1 Tax=Vreelandella neptunia TaxID=115551 RepID=A0ABS9S8U6_9GAMM|nr:transporter substrate-binding domain-containing protein [Halomonas neptunia]MCH4812535.1 transporter substrate-binding domain-containing protein [Halomonas neptunia]
MAVLWLWLAVVLGVHAETSEGLASLTFITEEYPPYNYVNNQQLTGRSIELLEAIFVATNTPLSRQDVRLYPWVRGYELALSQPNTVLFSTNRTAGRETSFHWVGPIGQDRIALLAHRNAPITIDSLAQAINQGLKVAVIREDIGAQALLEAGYPEHLMLPAIDNRSALHMLARGRVDLWAYSADVATWIAESEGFPKNSLTPIHTLSESSLYFAVNQATDQRLVSLMQQALEKVQASRPER